MEDPQLLQLISMVQKHHEKLETITRTLAKTPDPKTLRDIEHTFNELPPTDDLKDVVKLSKRPPSKEDVLEVVTAYKDRGVAFRRISITVIGTVITVAVMTIGTLVWKGLNLFVQGVS